MQESKKFRQFVHEKRTIAPYCEVMRLAENLETAAALSRQHLTNGVMDALTVQTRANGRGLEPAIATVAEREMFTEALLAAAHSHFEEIKTATAH